MSHNFFATSYFSPLSFLVQHVPVLDLGLGLDIEVNDGQGNDVSQSGNSILLPPFLSFAYN